MFAALSVFALQKCSGMHYELKVDSLSLPDGVSKTAYLMYPGNRDVREDNLQYLEFAKLAEQALKRRGFSKKHKADSANIVVLLAYGIGEPENHVYTHRVPVFGATGYTINQKITSNGLNATTTTTPQMGIVGTKEVVEVDVNYTRYLMMAAYDLDALKKKTTRQLWKTTVYSTGASDDLRKAFPYMIFGAIKHLGTRTSHRIVVDVKEDDEDVATFTRQAFSSRKKTLLTLP